ncbi:hypothetical protein MYXO_02628 [Myxococcaceae bacterium]|jgi:hypothetical protein|nr:hypothetical protein MYXO_02628 [Myxococcaceae bacterium]
MRTRWKRAVVVVIAGMLSIGASGEKAPESGTGIVEAKNLKDQTLQIDGFTYRVAPTTRLLDERGRPIPLAAVPVARTRRDDASVDVRAAVLFEAAEAGSGFVLESVQVVGELPR